jgi:hypothetical protein
MFNVSNDNNFVIFSETTNDLLIDVQIKKTFFNNVEVLVKLL